MDGADKYIIFEVLKKVIGAQGLGPLGDRTKRADRHEVPEESTTKKRSHSTDFKNWGHPRHLPLDRKLLRCGGGWN